MKDFTAIVRTLTVEQFNEILAASSRQAREIYFHRHSIRATQKSHHLPKPGQKNEQRAQMLYDVLKNNNDDQLCEELLRSFLLTKRSLLAKALDHLAIPHKDGLTDSDDVSKFEQLNAEQIRALVKDLTLVAPPHEICIYLKFMGAPSVDEALAEPNGPT